MMMRSAWNVLPLALASLVLAGCGATGGTESGTAAPSPAESETTSAPTWVAQRTTPAADSPLQPVGEGGKWVNRTEITQLADGDQVFLWDADPRNDQYSQQVALIYPAESKCEGTGKDVESAYYQTKVNSQMVYENATSNPYLELGASNMELFDAALSETPSVHALTVSEDSNRELPGITIEQVTNAWENPDGTVSLGSCAVVFGNYGSGDVAAYNAALDEARSLARQATVVRSDS